MFGWNGPTFSDVLDLEHFGQMYRRTDGRPNYRTQFTRLISERQPEIQETEVYIPFQITIKHLYNKLTDIPKGAGCFEMQFQNPIQEELHSNMLVYIAVELARLTYKNVIIEY